MNGWFNLFKGYKIVTNPFGRSTNRCATSINPFLKPINPFRRLTKACFELIKGDLTSRSLILGHLSNFTPEMKKIMG